MIDNKKIDEAARYYCNNRDSASPDAPFIAEGFRQGARWAIREFLKDLWHPNTEEPDKSKSDIITLGYYDDAYLQFKESIIWNKESWRHSISRNHIIKWAYLSNILPKEEDTHD